MVSKYNVIEHILKLPITTLKDISHIFETSLKQYLRKFDLGNNFGKLLPPINHNIFN